MLAASDRPSRDVLGSAPARKPMRTAKEAGAGCGERAGGVVFGVVLAAAAEAGAFHGVTLTVAIAGRIGQGQGTPASAGGNTSSTSCSRVGTGRRNHGVACSHGGAFTPSPSHTCGGSSRGRR